MKSHLKLIAFVLVLMLGLLGCSSDKTAESHADEPVKIEKVAVESSVEDSNENDSDTQTESMSDEVELTVGQGSDSEASMPETAGMEVDPENEVAVATAEPTEPASTSEPDDTDTMADEPVQEEPAPEEPSLDGERVIVPAEKVTVNTEINQETSMYTVTISGLTSGDSSIWERVFENVPMTELEPVSDWIRDTDRFYVGVSGMLYALDMWDGTDAFAPVSVGSMEAPVIGPDDGHIYCSGYYGAMLTKVSPDGQVVFKTDEAEPHQYWGRPVITGKSVFVFYQSFEEDPITNCIQVDRETGVIKRYLYAESDDIFWDDVVASSTLDGYPVENMMDDSMLTAWSEGMSGNGEGTTITFISENPVVVSAVYIQNGYHKSEALYNANARLNTLKFEDENGRIKEAYIPDVYTDHWFKFDEPFETRKLTLTIESVYPGTKYEDTLISSIYFK